MISLPSGPVLEVFSFDTATPLREHDQRSMLDLKSHPFLAVGMLKPYYFPKTVKREDHVVCSTMIYLLS